MAVVQNDIAITVVPANAVAVTVASPPVEVANDVFISAATNDISVTVGGVQEINVQATATGPAGNGLGMTLQDYGVKGQIQAWQGDLELTLDLGNVIQANLTGSVDSMTLTGWPNVGIEGKLVLYITQGIGPYNISGWPSQIKWLGGLPPLLVETQGQVDVVVLTSIDAGTTIFGFHVGVAA